MPCISEEDRTLAARLPRFVRFGTSSWSFPGWAGVVWGGHPNEMDLARAGLRAYAQHPLLRTVGLDRSYYGPLRVEDLTQYAEQLDEATRSTSPEHSPPPFHVVSKVWEEITTAIYPRHPRYGARAGSANPHFLDADRFLSEVLGPYHAAAGFLKHAGPFVFELTPFPRGAIDEQTLVTRVADFLGRLPSGPGHRWAFELRNPELFGRRWIDMLRANGAAHVFTFWTAMPPLRDQLQARAIMGDFTVVRLMLPPYTRYAFRKSDFAPFDAIIEPHEEMREDVVAVLRAAAVAGCKEAFVLVNNKAEGSAPLTIRALAAKTAEAFEKNLP